MSTLALRCAGGRRVAAAGAPAPVPDEAAAAAAADKSGASTLSGLEASARANTPSARSVWRALSNATPYSIVKAIGAALSEAHASSSAAIKCGVGADADAQLVAV